MCRALAALVHGVVVIAFLYPLTFTSAPARAEPAPTLTLRLDTRSHRGMDWGERAALSSRGGEIVISPGPSRGPLSLIVLGAGVASTGVGAYFGLRNLSANSDYDNATTAAARADARDRAQTSATIANASWIASGALIAAGLGILFLTDW